MCRLVIIDESPTPRLFLKFPVSLKMLSYRRTRSRYWELHLFPSEMHRDMLFSLLNSQSCSSDFVAMTPRRSLSFFSPVDLLLLFLFYGSLLACTALSSGDEGFVVEGRVKLEAMRGKGLGKLANMKVVLNGGEQVSFVRQQDGSFVFEDVPAGTHLVEVVALGYLFSPVRLDVSSRLAGQIRASYVEGPRRISDALVLEPRQEEYYYEVREPFSLFGLLKSPMGLMIGFMIICVFLLPMLMDSIDPEEVKRLQEAQRANPSPVAQFLQART